MMSSVEATHHPSSTELGRLDEWGQSLAPGVTVSVEREDLTYLRVDQRQRSRATI